MTGGLLLSVMIALSAVTAPAYVDIGDCRVTTYCPSCNTGAGHASSSGVYLEEGHAACRWLKNGTVVVIGGNEYEIVDTCGTEAIDIFVDTDVCQCNVNKYERVLIRKERPLWRNTTKARL